MQLGRRGCGGTYCGELVEISLIKFCGLCREMIYLHAWKKDVTTDGTLFFNTSSCVHASLYDPPGIRKCASEFDEAQHSHPRTAVGKVALYRCMAGPPMMCRRRNTKLSYNTMVKSGGSCSKHQLDCITDFEYILLYF